jgi:DNA-directed RNA polymerase omega subunit
MKRVTIEEIWELFPNKYEAIVIAAQEARRIARMAREQNVKLPRKPSILAMERLIRGEIKYYIDEKEE